MIGKLPLRVGNVSGATGDHPHAMARMVKSGNVDVITGDWLSEMNIAWNAIVKRDTDPDLGYEDGFYQQLDECLDDIVEKGIKVVTNAGALNTLSLYNKVQDLCKRRGHGDVVIAAVLGDDVTDIITDPQRRSQLQFAHLDHQERLLDNWELEPFCATAYIGCQGIAKALKAGASIVICGRVTDASPVMGACAWYFGWQEEQYDEFAGSLLAAHLIECGPYVVGANFSGFKEFLPELFDLAFPIAEIDSAGRCVITKTADGGGRVTADTVKAQMLYELQGHLYLNPDVVGDLSKVHIEAIDNEPNRVRVYGACGLPPPPTTKVMFAAPGGYQAEATFYINGLDVAEKVAMMRKQLEYAFRNNNFSKLSIEQYGAQVDNPSTQQAGTVQLRVFAQARQKRDIAPSKFKIPIYALRMQSYPGYHMGLDFRTMEPKAFMEIFPATIPISALDLKVRLSTGDALQVAPPKATGIYPTIRPSYETAEPMDLNMFGATKTAPLGSIVHARSGDKADNSNVGFFVRHQEEYSWLQAFLTVERLKELFGDDWFKCDPQRRVERVEFPGIFAVHL